LILHKNNLSAEQENIVYLKINDCLILKVKMNPKH